MGLQGKGFFIWNIANCERGSPHAIAAAAREAGFTHVLIKIADGNYPHNIDKQTRIDLAPPVVEALRRQNLQVWGWHYVYGYDPQGEARIAIRRVQQLNLDGYVIDAEAEYKEPNRATAARRFMKDLRAGLPSLPVALSSYRFPSYHRQLPWREFLEYCDYNMPQVYWEKSHNPAAQLVRTLREFQSLYPVRPVIPTGPAYKWNGWRPTEDDLREFFNATRAAGLSAINFFSWDECRRDLPNLWDLIAAAPFGSAPAPEPPPADISEQYIQALNQGNLDALLALYRPEAVHITAARTIQGHAALRDWYQTLISEQLPQATFHLTGSTGGGAPPRQAWRRHSWRATSPRGQVDNGSDTLGLLEGKIIYHYTSFSVI